MTSVSTSDSPIWPVLISRTACRQASGAAPELPQPSQHGMARFHNCVQHPAQHTLRKTRLSDYYLQGGNAYSPTDRAAGHNQEQESQTSQKPEVAASPIMFEPHEHLAHNSSAQSWMAQAQSSADAVPRPWQTRNMAPGSSSDGPSSTGRAPAQKPVTFQSTERSLHMPKAPAPAVQSSSGENLHPRAISPASSP